MSFILIIYIQIIYSFLRVWYLFEDVVQGHKANYDDHVGGN